MVPAGLLSLLAVLLLLASLAGAVAGAWLYHRAALGRSPVPPLTRAGRAREAAASGGGEPDDDQDAPPTRKARAL